MSNIPADLRYSKDDEWVKVDEENIAIVGITDFAQDALSDIVYLELPSEGDSFEQEDAFGVVESVKAASDLYMPAGGTITAVNEDLADTPEDINSEPYESWLVKIQLSDPSQLDDLMDATAYESYCQERE